MFQTEFQTRTESNTGRKFIIYCKIKTGTPKFFAQIIFIL